MVPHLAPPPAPTAPRRARWPRWLIAGVVVFSALLIGARIAAPWYLERAINQRLSRIPYYGGHVGDIDLAVWRGAYRINDLTILKQNGRVKEPFFSARQIEFSVAWREVFRGRFVSQITVDQGQLTLVRGVDADTTQLPADHRWQDAINDLFPIDITLLDVTDGMLRYVDKVRDPQVNLAITAVRLQATGLRNRARDANEEFPAHIDLSGQTPGHGQLRLFTKLEPLATQPHLELNVELTDVSLPVMNDFLRAYANVDVSRGRFELFGQLAMASGRYEGYVKPFFEQIDFTDLPQQDKSLGERVWETIVAGIVKLVKNKERNQFATRIPFAGEAGSTDVKTWTSILNALHHGFVEALKEGFEGTTHPDDPKSSVPTPPPAAKP